MATIPKTSGLGLPAGKTSGLGLPAGVGPKPQSGAGVVARDQRIVPVIFGLNLLAYPEPTLATPYARHVTDDATSQVPESLRGAPHSYDPGRETRTGYLREPLHIKNKTIYVARFWALSLLCHQYLPTNPWKCIPSVRWSKLESLQSQDKLVQIIDINVESIVIRYPAIYDALIHGITTKGNKWGNITTNTPSINRWWRNSDIPGFEIGVGRYPDISYHGSVWKPSGLGFSTGVKVTQYHRTRVIESPIFSRMLARMIISHQNINPLRLLGSIFDKILKECFDTRDLITFSEIGVSSYGRKTPASYKRSLSAAIANIYHDIIDDR